MKTLTKALAFCMLVQFASAQESIPLKGDELFGALRARHIGPALMSGRFVDLEGHPTNPKVFYAGAAGGGVWKTNNAGITFNPIFDKHNQSIGAIAVDPKNPDQEIWVGTGEIWTRNSVTIGDGIYKSEDGGSNWKNMGLAKSERISAIKINPKNTKEIYVGVLGALWGDSDERGVYKTTNGGQTWEKIFFINKGTGCSDIVMDVDNPNVLYASFWEFRRTAYSFNSGGENSGLYKSLDGGKSWNKIHNGFPNGKLGRIAIAQAPSNGKILYAAIESETDEGKGMYRSDDAGATWIRTNGDFGIVVRPFYFSRIVVDPKNPDVLLKAGLRGSISRDSGKTFRDINGGTHADIHDFIFDINNSDNIYLCDDGGVYRSWDGGLLFDMVKGLPVSQFYQVAVDNQKPYKVYGGLQDNGSWIGPSQKPGGIENRDWISVGAGDGFRVFPHPTDPNIVYSEMQGAENIWRVNLSKNSAKTIKPYPKDNEEKNRFNWNTPILTSMHKPDRLYCGSQFLMVSEDRGETWTKISPDLTTNDKSKLQQENSGGLSVDNSGAENHCTIFSIAESPLDVNTIWVGTDDGNIQLTTDGGKTWTKVNDNVVGVPKNTWISFIEPSQFDKNTAYVVFDGHAASDFKSYAYKTTDAGKTWSSVIKSDLGTYARCIKEDHKNPNLLFLGTESGLFVTVDGGNNWAQFNNNMPPVAVHWIAQQKREDAIVMATHGRGVIIIDDVSPLRQITKEILNEDLVFFKGKPNVIEESGSFGGYARVGEFVGQNPSSDAQINYFLKSRHTFGKMSLEIFDKSGEKVADLVPGKSKGINSVNWSYKVKPPKIAKAKTIVREAFATASYPAGTYKVKINKGSKVYETEVVLISDENSILTDEDRKIQFETAMKMHEMNERLAFAVQTLDDISSKSEKIIPMLTSSKLKKNMPIEAIVSEIKTYKKGLVVLTGDNYTATAEPQLREKIGALYGDIAGYSGRPTNAQMSNFKLLSTQLEAVEKQVNTWKSSIEKMNPELVKLKMEAFKFGTFEAFKNSTD